MNKQRLTAIIILVCVFAIFWLASNDKKQQENQNSGPGFKQVGNIIKNNPGFTRDVWYLVYEIAGAPSATAMLDFNGDSNCRIFGKAIDCGELNLANGTRVWVAGSITDSKVMVSSLTTESDAETRTVKLYYYNQLLDKKLLCSKEAIVPIEQQIPFSNTPIQDTIRLLISRSLTEQEKTLGFATEFPNKDFKLLGAKLRNEVLTLEFSDPANFSVGGSCRVSILWAQIEKTALQFEEVKQVKFIPEELFQP